ncbi:hypothetical protein VPHK406_0041 [Vibrio phage K406]
MIRELLCSEFKNFKRKFNMSYTDMQYVSGLSRSQLYNILNDNGEGVKVERIEQALTNCGYTIRMEVTL